MSTNISKQKRDDLISKIGSIRTYISTAPQDENTGALLTYLSELEKEVKSKKYGLVFEEHREGIDDVLAANTPVMTEEKDLFIDNGGQMNFLIEGDNLAALQLLMKTHKGKIDLIYIDPPYNNGGDDFVYDDKRIDKTDTFKHSKWLSFLRNRLEIACRLLSPTGLIFISINDKEQPGLKLLCDAILGEDNFVANIANINNPKGRSDDKYFATAHEYLLVYRKTERSTLGGFEPEDNILRRYNKTDEKGRKFREIDLRKTGDQDRKVDRPKMFYYFYYDKKTSEFFPSFDEIEDAKYIKIMPIKDDGEYGRWRWGIETAVENIDKIFPKYMPTRKMWGVMEKDYLDERKLVKPTTSWTFKDVNSERGTEAFIALGFAKQQFQNPKPIGTIQRVVQIASPDEGIVLDFFAGSGTTGHSVLKLNADDNSKRKFILCTNNENNICRDVTYERIKRVIDKEDYNASIKYYKIDYIPINERMYYEYADELLHHVRELVELENGINFTGNAEIAIILTDDELEGFVANVQEYEKCRRIYRGHDILLSAEQEATLQERDITVCVIPDYYYRELEGGQ